MAEPIHAAQNGVLDAIEALHSSKVYIGVITDLLECVLPVYMAASTSLDWGIGQGQGVVKGQASQSPSPFMSWDDRLDDRRSILSEVEIALQAWARRFRLTQDLSQTGECLPWIVKFGHELCEGRSYRVQDLGGDSAMNRLLTDIAPLREGVQVPDPNTKVVRRSEYLDRVEDAHRDHYKALSKRQRSKPRQDKRNREHYKWFVLGVCGGLSFKQISHALGVRLEPDTVRKGIDRVCDELALSGNRPS